MKTKEYSSQKNCILVAGMHRSGTSATARVINLLGADIDSKLLVASEDNTSGYWESVDLYVLHENALEKLGISWDSILPVPGNWFRNLEYLELQSLLKRYIATHFDSSTRFVIKDPRIARFLSLWIEVLLDLTIDIKIVVPFRNPSEVIESLNKREVENILHKGQAFSNQYASLLWLRHILEAEKDSRGLKRSFVSYDSLLKDWYKVSKKIEIDLDLKWNPKKNDFEQKINSFIRSDLYRNRDIWIDEIENLPWVKKVFEALYLLELDPYDPTAMQTLDNINEELARADGIFTEIIKESEAKAKELKSKQEKNQQQIANLQSKLAHIEHERNMAMQDSFQELRLERDKLLAQVQDLSAKVTSLTQENENAKVSDNLIKDKSQIKHE